jgi:hypothetical protein
MNLPAPHEFLNRTDWNFECAILRKTKMLILRFTETS